MAAASPAAIHRGGDGGLAWGSSGPVTGPTSLTSPLAAWVLSAVHTRSAGYGDAAVHQVWRWSTARQLAPSTYRVTEPGMPDVLRVEGVEPVLRGPFGLRFGPRGTKQCPVDTMSPLIGYHRDPELRGVFVDKPVARLVGREQPVPAGPDPSSAFSAITPPSPRRPQSLM
jgi:hypothetical protein